MEIYHQIRKGSCLNCKKCFYLQQQNLCPLCKSELKSKLIYQCPIQFPKPRHLVVVKSFGKLTPNDYNENDILHIGISDSKGNIYSFWNKFLIDQKNNRFWQNSVSIDLKVNHITNEIWDQTLNIHRKSMQENPVLSKYHEINNNCFDYVVSFLNEIQFQSRQNWNKEQLADNIIKPKIDELEKYCKIYKDFYVTFKKEFKETKIAPATCDVCEIACTVQNRYKCLVCEDYDLCKKCFDSNKHEHPLIEFW